jgi:hypothetical protein
MPITWHRLLFIHYQQYSIMIATLERTKLSIEEQTKVVRQAFEYLNENELWKEEDLLPAVQYWSEGLTPHEEFEAFILCRKYWRQLKKAGIELPTKADWQNTYAIKDMQVWNLTKRSGPYTLTWIGDEALECDCQAYTNGNECGHVAYGYSQLGLADAVGNAVVSAPTPAPVIPATDPDTDHEILPGIFATQSQWEALQNLLAFARGEKGLTYCLSGFAGTGKSLLVQALVAKLRSANDDRKISFTAPTNKAVRVLSTMVAEWGLGVECQTCAKLLALTPKIDRETGLQVFEPDWDLESTVQDYDLIIVDECSMISQDLWGYLLAEVNLMTRFLFMGDPYQAPPIGESISRSFFEISDQSALTEIKRYGGPIGAVCADIRSNLKRRGEPIIESDHNPDKTEGVFNLPRERWTAALIKAFQSESYQNDPDSVRAIAYTNRQVLKINNIVRKAIRGADAPRFVVGERLIARSHYAMEDIYGNDQKVFSTADEMEITGVRIGKAGDYKTWMLNVQIFEDNRQPVCVPVLHEDSLALYEERLSERKKARAWEQFWALKNRFADLRYAYCLTAHQSQGSTFRNVFVDVPNILGNNTKNMVTFPGTEAPQLVWERNQLLYVAVSRASQRLFVPE